MTEITPKPSLFCMLHWPMEDFGSSTGELTACGLPVRRAVCIGSMEVVCSLLCTLHSAFCLGTNLSWRRPQHILFSSSTPPDLHAFSLGDIKTSRGPDKIPQSSQVWPVDCMFFEKKITIKPAKNLHSPLLRLYFQDISYHCLLHPSSSARMINTHRGRIIDNPVRTTTRTADESRCRY